MCTGPEMIEKLQYRFRRNKVDPDAIEDVYDGELYKEHASPGGFVSSVQHILLGQYRWCCTDTVKWLWSLACLPHSQ